MEIAFDQPAVVPALTIAIENEGDIAAREALLDRAMGPKRKRKSSQKLRRGRRPSEGLSFVARDETGAAGRHRAAVGRRRWALTARPRCCSGRSPSIRR